MPRIRRGGRRLRAEGGRTRKQDCCCDSCDAATAEELKDYLVAVSARVTLTITSDDYLAACCSALAGTWELPIFSVTPFFSGWNVVFKDSFAGVTICGSSRTVTPEVLVFISDAVGLIQTNVSATVTGNLNSVAMQFGTDVYQGLCTDTIQNSYVIPATRNPTGNFSCENDAGVTGDAEVEFLV